MVRIGLISDTHGLLRPEALQFLHGADHVIHGGDIGDASLLDALAAVAPVTAVRGNNDRAGWDHLATEVLLQFEELSVLALHDVGGLRERALPAGVRVVVSGHSHRPSICERGGVLFVNPGSAGPRRFQLPITAGELLVDGRTATARWVDLMHR
jgi:hypothetical protein